MGEVYNFELVKYSNSGPAKSAIVTAGGSLIVPGILASRPILIELVMQLLLWMCGSSSDRNIFSVPITQTYHCSYVLIGDSNASK